MQLRQILKILCSNSNNKQKKFYGKKEYIKKNSYDVLTKITAIYKIIYTRIFNKLTKIIKKWYSIMKIKKHDKIRAIDFIVIKKGLQKI